MRPNRSRHRRRPARLSRSSPGRCPRAQRHRPASRRPLRGCGCERAPEVAARGCRWRPRCRSGRRVQRAMRPGPTGRAHRRPPQDLPAWGLWGLLARWRSARPLPHRRLRHHPLPHPPPAETTSRPAAQRPLDLSACPWRGPRSRRTAQRRPGGHRARQRRRRCPGRCGKPRDPCPGHRRPTTPWCECRSGHRGHRGHHCWPEWRHHWPPMRPKPLHRPHRPGPVRAAGPWAAAVSRCPTGAAVRPRPRRRCGGRCRFRCRLRCRRRGRERRLVPPTLRPQPPQRPRPRHRPLPCWRCRCVRAPGGWWTVPRCAAPGWRRLPRPAPGLCDRRRRPCRRCRVRPGWGCQRRAGGLPAGVRLCRGCAGPDVRPGARPGRSRRWRHRAAGCRLRLGSACRAGLASALQKPGRQAPAPGLRRWPRWLGW